MATSRPLPLDPVGDSPAEASPYRWAPASRLAGAGAPKVRALTLDGVPPSFEGVATGAYPVVRPVNLVALSEPSGELRQFVAWALSNEGQRVAANLGYVPANQMQR